MGYRHGEPAGNYLRHRPLDDASLVLVELHVVVMVVVRRRHVVVMHVVCGAVVGVGRRQVLHRGLHRCLFSTTQRSPRRCSGSY